MTPAPLVSVVIPTYNAPALLLETLATVRAQTFTDFEVVIVNDGSTDDTAERIQPLLAADSRVRLVTQANSGIGAARNRGIDESRGQYVALLDHDDLWLPDKLATQVSYMQDHPECAGCSVPWARTDAPDRPVCDFAALVDDRGHVVRPLRALAHGNVFLISSSILFDRARAHGLRYMPYRRCIEDTPFQVKLFARGEFGIAGDRILMLYRVHASNYSGQADFFYNGVKMLRRMDRAGDFAELSAAYRADWLDFVAHLGRSASVHQVQAGLRLRGAEMFAREFPHQLRRARLRFLLGFPATLAASFVRRPTRTQSS